jgi:drug/metabolite transporter (DMT)-like permease
MKFLRWSYVWVLGLLIIMAGIGSVENPDNNLLTGVLVLYSGVFVLTVATVQLSKLGR